MNDTQFSAAVGHTICRIRKTGILLKPEQVQAAYQRRDVFLWLLTGFSKSIDYEVLPFFLHLSVALKYKCYMCCLGMMDQVAKFGKFYILSYHILSHSARCFLQRNILHRHTQYLGYS